MGIPLIIIWASLAGGLDVARETEGRTVLAQLLDAERAHWLNRGEFTSDLTTLNQYVILPAWRRDWGSPRIHLEPTRVTITLDGSGPKNANGFGGHGHPGHTMVGWLTQDGQRGIRSSGCNPPSMLSPSRYRRFQSP